jgi:hypothetical protein
MNTPRTSKTSQAIVEPKAPEAPRPRPMKTKAATSTSPRPMPARYGLSETKSLQRLFFLKRNVCGEIEPRITRGPGSASAATEWCG